MREAASELNRIGRVQDLVRSRRTGELRNRVFFVFDAFAVLLIPFLAFALRLENGAWQNQDLMAVLLFALLAVSLKLPVFIASSLYNRYWLSASTGDLASVFAITVLASAALGIISAPMGLWLTHPGLGLSYSLPIIDGLLTALAVGGVRLLYREAHSWYRQRAKPLAADRVLVVGAGAAGISIVQHMRANPHLGMLAEAFVDEDSGKVGTVIEGVPVLGSVASLSEIIARYNIQRIILAIPSTPHKAYRAAQAACQLTGLPVLTVPMMYELLEGSKTINHLPDIDVHRLLRRAPVSIDRAEAQACLGGAIVLVTGAGGSIGSELCHQIAQLGPRMLILVGHGENSIFEIELSLRLLFPGVQTYPVIADIRDRERIDRVVERFRPDIIFHAAAHKHVHYMEASVDEAVRTNVLGSYNVLRAAERHGVERLVLISSDKAVNPIGVMGTTKRLAELLVQAAARRTGNAYVAVRFGNVLGSRGSVVRVFQQQIAAGGPLTITHPDMLRYFMTIPEAVQLVLQAAVLGQSGEIFVLDMGKPVRVMDLAQDMIRLAGLRPGRDIEIVQTGIRPGEKLAEELFLNSENYERTRHNRIFVARADNIEEADTVTRLVGLAQQLEYDNLGKLLRQSSALPLASSLPMEKVRVAVG